MDSQRRNRDRLRHRNGDSLRRFESLEDKLALASVSLSHSLTTSVDHIDVGDCGYVQTTRIDVVNDEWGPKSITTMVTASYLDIDRCGFPSGLAEVSGAIYATIVPGLNDRIGDPAHLYVEAISDESLSFLPTSGDDLAFSVAAPDGTVFLAGDLQHVNRIGDISISASVGQVIEIQVAQMIHAQRSSWEESGAYGGHQSSHYLKLNFSAGLGQPSSDISVDSSAIGISSNDTVWINYAVANRDLPDDTSFSFYWSANATLDALDKMVTTQPVTGIDRERGLHFERFPGQNLGQAPPRTRYLIAVADPPKVHLPDGVISESNEYNNVSVHALTCEDLLAKSITKSQHVVLSGPEINIEFIPRFGLPLADAKAVCGVDGFNWYQLVSPPAAEEGKEARYSFYIASDVAIETASENGVLVEKAKFRYDDSTGQYVRTAPAGGHATGSIVTLQNAPALIDQELSAPGFLDPLIRTKGTEIYVIVDNSNRGRFSVIDPINADAAPFYWNVADVGIYTLDDKLKFEDTPTSTLLGPNEAFSFVTRLVGYKGNEIKPFPFSPGVTWKSNAISIDPGNVDTFYPDGRPARQIVSGGVFDVEALGPLVGDANLDWHFDSSDLVAVFQEGRYESNLPATWAEGDWDSDGLFDSGDLVAAFQAGAYEQVTASLPLPSLFVDDVFSSVHTKRQPSVAAELDGAFSEWSLEKPAAFAA